MIIDRCSIKLWRSTSQFLFASVAMLHPPSRAYVEPWTGELFGEGGVEQDPHIYPASAAAGVHGEVIMAKLGNATAKYVRYLRIRTHILMSIVS